MKYFVYFGHDAQPINKKSYNKFNKLMQDGEVRNDDAWYVFGIVSGGGELTLQARHIEGVAKFNETKE